MLNQSQASIVLSLSPYTDDHDVLADILHPYEWTMHRVATLSGATDVLAHHRIGVVICERYIPPHSWTDLLAEIASAANAPSLIITSRHADDRFWAEALNLGAYDVLPKPFDAAEVRRTLSIALLHWQWNLDRASRLLGKAAGASMANGVGLQTRNDG